jgi:fructosamine-3-kinase
MSGLPESLREAVTQAIIYLGDPSSIHSVRSLGGGCINNAMRLETRNATYLLKWNSEPLPGMFTCEARGLEYLAATHTVRVPVVYASAEASDGHPAYILTEFLEGSGTNDQAKLGEELAELHRQVVSPTYGLDHDNYLGATRQVNEPASDWIVFFTESRLRPQMELAIRNGHLSGDRRLRLEMLIDRLPELLGGYTPHPSLIHGDLWGGNVIPGPDGPALIDPAVSYSDREAEIAYTELFGGFSTRFYAAYQQTWPLDPGYPQRRAVYNLYHLLNHLNLFGESYGYQVDQVLRRYAG